MKEYTKTPAGWMKIDVPEVDEGMTGWYWVWVISKYADYYGNPITEREPEIVRIEGAETIDQRRIHLTGQRSSRTYSDFNPPGRKIGSRDKIVLWKGPLNHG